MNRRRRNMGFWVRRQKKRTGRTTKQIILSFKRIPWFHRMIIKLGISRQRRVNQMNRENDRDKRIHPWESWSYDNGF